MEHVSKFSCPRCYTGKSVESSHLSDWEKWSDMTGGQNRQIGEAYGEVQQTFIFCQIEQEIRVDRGQIMEVIVD